MYFSAPASIECLKALTSIFTSHCRQCLSLVGLCRTCRSGWISDDPKTLGSSAPRRRHALAEIPPSRFLGTLFGRLDLLSGLPPIQRRPGPKLLQGLALAGVPEVDMLQVWGSLWRGRPPRLLIQGSRVGQRDIGGLEAACCLIAISPRCGGVGQFSGKRCTVVGRHSKHSGTSRRV